MGGERRISQGGVGSIRVSREGGIKDGGVGSIRMGGEAEVTWEGVSRVGECELLGQSLNQGSHGKERDK